MRENGTPTKFKIDHRILKIMGYDPPERHPSRISSLINEYLENAPLWINPSFRYVIKNVEKVSGKYSYIEGNIFLESEVITCLLERCSKVAVFVLTIGSTLEKISAGLIEHGAVLKASVMDAVGSVLAERLADEVQSQIQAEAQTMGLAISRRFSPGYCDWPVSGQRALFKALGEQTAGVKITGSCLMLPRKSVSGIIGLGPFGQADEYVPCRTCEKNRKCPWRRL